MDKDKKERPQLPDAAVDALNNQLHKVAMRVRDRGQHFNNDLISVFKEYLKDYREVNYVAGNDVENAVTAFTAPWLTAVCHVEQQRYVDKLSAKIHEVNEADRTSQ